MDKRETKTHYALVKITDPKKDPPNSEETWKKSNPSYGVLVNKESFVSEYESAKLFPQRLLGFVAYRCNALIAPLSDNTSRFTSREIWDGLKGNTEIEEASEIVCSWDCASSQDLTAIVWCSVEPPHRIGCKIIVPPAAVKKKS